MSKENLKSSGREILVANFRDEPNLLLSIFYVDISPIFTSIRNTSKGRPKSVTVCSRKKNRAAHKNHSS